MGLLTWNGIPLLVSDVQGELEQWLRQFHAIDEIIAFCGIEAARISSTNAPQSIAGNGITAPNFPSLPPLAINELIMPTGAQRFGYFVGLLPADATGVGPPGSTGSLVLSDGANSQTVSLRVLSFRPLTVIDGGNQAALLILVDARYSWQFLNGGNLIQESGYPLLETSGPLSGTPNNDYGQDEIGYSEVFSALESRMGVTFNRPVVTGFSSLDVLELTNRKHFNAAAMLDAVCESCGLRVWVGFDGSVNLYDSTIGYGSNFNDLENLCAGGLQTISEAKPATFQVSFPRATWNASYPDGDRFAIENAIGTGGAGGGSSGTITVNSSCYAHWTALPDNYSNPPSNLSLLESLAANIQSGVMQWWRPAYDATFLGIKPWTQSGFDNFIAISYATLRPNDVYNAPVVSDFVPKEDTKFDLNYQVFTTRAQSMPNNFGSRINLSQDPSVRFLRGWQWGKLATAQTPSIIATSSVYPQPTTVSIWQYDASGKESDTGIRIQAFPYDADGEPLPSESRVTLQFHSVNRRWVFARIASDSAIIQIAGSGEVQRNAYCVWPANVVQVSTANAFCSDANFTTSTDIWVAIFNGNGSPPVVNLHAGDRYFAKLVGTYTVGGGTARPLYVIEYDRKLIRFQLITPLALGVVPPSNNAVEIQWNSGAGQYVPVGSLITVVDYFAPTGGEFCGAGTSGVNAGYRGWAEWKSDDGVFEIVWMEKPAQFIQFMVQTSALTPTTPSVRVQVVNYWQGRNPDPQSAGLLVHNPIDNQGSGVFAAPRFAVGLACYDDRLDQYRIVYAQNKPQFVIGTLTTALAAGAATGGVTYSWGPEVGVPLSAPINLVDKTSPSIFTGAVGNQYHATYDAVLDKYVITWIQCG